MSKQRNEEGDRLSTARTPRERRTDGAQGGAHPRPVTTGENNTEGSPTFTGENFFQSERIELVTDGKRGRVILHPLPLESVSQQVAHNDWIAFTLIPPDDCGLEWLYPQLQAVWGISMMVHKPGRKFNGYENTYELTSRDGNMLGLLGIGGEHQRGTIHVSLNAGCCALVPDWEKAVDWGESLNARITRVDVAHDDFNGESINIQKAREWHEAGMFGSGGRNPKARLIDDLGSGDGKTFYVGGRGNGKYCRVYEKGKQLGDPTSPWVRLEVELKGSKTYKIPWDILTRPGQYLAGSYPCFNFLSEVQEKIRTISKAVKISFKRAVENARQMVGKTVNVMMQFHGGDYVAVVNELKRDGVPRRLENYADFLPVVLEGIAP